MNHKSLATPTMTLLALLALIAGAIAVRANAQHYVTIASITPQAAQVSSVTGSIAPLTSLGGGFTYHGRITSSGSPANGQYDLRFALFDDATGQTQVGSTIFHNNQSVSDGLFGVQLDFGQAVFQGEALWLEVAVKRSSDPTYTTLTPRQALTAVPYALSLKAGAVISDTGSSAILTANNSGGSDGSVGVQGSGYIGLFGTSPHGNGEGVKGEVTSISPAIEGNNQGAGTGVFGSHSSTTGTGAGVRGETQSTDAYAEGVTGIVTSTSPGLYSVGVHGINNGVGSNGIGVWGSHAGSGYGVYGTSVGGYGVIGSSYTNVGVYGISTSGNGIYGVSSVGNGVYGATGGSNTVAGVYGSSTASQGIGVWGDATGDFGRGVRGTGSSWGVDGSSAIGVGVRGVTSSGRGVVGQSISGTGVTGTSDSGPGVSATSLTGYAMSIYGPVSQGGGSGWAQAMVRVGGGTITRCYSPRGSTPNYSPPCGFTLTQNGPGDYTIDFGFTLTSNYFSVLPEYNGGLAVIPVIYSFPSSTAVRVRTYSGGSTLIESAFYLVLY